MTTPPRKRKATRPIRRGQSRYANMPDTPVLRKKKKKAKPMTVWVAIYTTLDNFPSSVFRSKRAATKWVGECYDPRPYRVVAFTERGRK